MGVDVSDDVSAVVDHGAVAVVAFFLHLTLDVAAGPQQVGLVAAAHFCTPFESGTDVNPLDYALHAVPQVGANCDQDLDAHQVGDVLLAPTHHVDVESTGVAAVKAF